MAEWIKRNKQVLTDEDVERADREAAGGASFEPAGIVLTPCYCGDMRVGMAFVMAEQGFWFMMDLHLPDDVDLPRAMRNYQAMVQDVLCNGKVVDEDLGTSSFPVLAQRLPYHEVVIGGIRRMDNIETLFARDRQRDGESARDHDDLHA